MSLVLHQLHLFLDIISLNARMKISIAFFCIPDPVSGSRCIPTGIYKRTWVYDACVREALVGLVAWICSRDFQ